MSLAVPDNSVGRTVELVSAFCGHPLGEPQRGAAALSAADAGADGDGGDATTLAAACALLASRSCRPGLLGASPEEQARAREWLTWSAAELADGAPALDDRSLALEAHLAPRTYLAGGPSPTVADVAALGQLHPYLRAMPPAQAGQYACVRRWADLVQHVAGEAGGGALDALFGRLALVDLAATPFVPPAAVVVAAAAPAAAAAGAGPAALGAGAAPAAAAGSGSVKGSGKKTAVAAAVGAATAGAAAAVAGTAATAAKGGKKGAEDAAAAAPPAADAAAAPAAAAAKKEKPKKEAKPAAPAAPKPEDDPRPDHLDLRVGVVTEVSRHPNADALYVETIDLGEASGARQIISGLVKFVPEEGMRGRRVVVACNLKAAKMRDVMSYGMVSFFSFWRGGSGRLFVCGRGGRWSARAFRPRSLARRGPSVRPCRRRPSLSCAFRYRRG